MSPRLSVNEITSDQLDRLYERAIQYRAAWHSARRRARGRTQAEAALDRVTKLAAVWDDAPDPLAQAMARDLRTAINGPKEH